MAGDLDPQQQLSPILLSPRARGLLAIGYALIVAAVVLDLATGPRSTFSPLLAAVPVLAGTSTRKARVPLLCGASAVVGVWLLAVGNTGVPLVVHATATATVLAVTCGSTAAVVLAAAREQQLAQVRSVAATAQRALLRPVPPLIGSLQITVRYLAAAAEARIGGDLYEVMATPFGTRLILGDVRGKGLQAVETAADVLGVFRDAARAEPDLARVAAHLDAALARRPASEEFVTAILLSIPESDEPARMVNCGHPDALLLGDGTADWLEPAVRLPPLAMGGMVATPYRDSTFELRRGETLLLYTDGASEARDLTGRFYPLDRRLAQMSERDPDLLLDRLVMDLKDYVPDGLTDDTALLALRRA